MDRLLTHSDLLSRLQIDGAELKRIVRARESFYVERRLKRKSRRRPRVVYEVLDGLRRIQRIIAVMLNPDLTQMHDCVTGFRKHRNTRTHALPHCGAQLVATADIKSFFASISDTRVMDLFVSLGASPNVAVTLMRLTTLHGILPEGARSSPAIANLIGQDLDRVILQESANRWRYTRYVDDLAFSGAQVPAREDVNRWMVSAGFELKTESYRVRHISQGPYVTGLFVGGAAPRVPRKLRRMIARTLFYLAKPDGTRALLQMKSATTRRNKDESSGLNGLIAIIHSINGVEPQLARAYLEQLASIFGDQ